MPNNNSKHLNRPQPSPQLFEGLQYRDLDGLLKPTLHVDEFSSKMGDDSDVMVISFFAVKAATTRKVFVPFEHRDQASVKLDRSVRDAFSRHDPLCSVRT